MKPVTLSGADRKSVRTANARTLSDRAKKPEEAITSETRWAITPQGKRHVTVGSPLDRKFTLTTFSANLPQSLAEFVQDQVRTMGHSPAEVIRRAVLLYRNTHRLGGAL